MYALGITLPALASLHASPIPSFSDVSVHDPSVVEADGAYYVFGSHLASAWSPDLMNWYQVSSSVVDGNPLFPNVTTDLADVLAYSKTDTLWAPDVHRMPDGRFEFYYCACEGSSPLSSLGHASSDTILGPYEDEGVLLQSGMTGTSEDGSVYNSTRHPNAVDPTLFNSPDGRLFMVYGSYSGGIFVMEMDPDTGVQLSGQGYGTKIMGGNHVRIEGAYTAYNEDTGYYYLFVSFGGLDSDGGYNIRVCRATSPTGPYYDTAGQNMTGATGASGTFFDDDAIAPYGAKLMGNYQFAHDELEHYTTSTGYISPGHNSILYDSASGKWFNVFHTRFVGQDEAHQVRVHQMFFNADGWPVVAPHRYAGETIGSYDTTSLAGTYKVINHGKDISTTVKTSTNWVFNADGSISDVGTWTLDSGHNVTISLSGIQYKGVFCKMWDDDKRLWVNTFTALSEAGIALWGSEVGVPKRSQPYTAPAFASVGAQAMRPGETLTVTLEDMQETTPYLYEFRLIDAPTGATVDALTGRVSYTALPSDSGEDKTVTVEAYDAIETGITAQIQFPIHIGTPLEYESIENTFASAASSGLKDSAGVMTGLSARLSGTSTPTNDTRMTLNTSSAVLNIKTSTSDLNGQAGVNLMCAPGHKLSDFGFNGDEDFVVRAEFGAISNLATADQVGIYVGSSVTNVTRAGVIYLGSNQAYSVHTSGTTDTGGHFTSTIDLGDGMTVVIARQQGEWLYYVDGVPTYPLTGAPDFLDSLSDLTVGVFAITPLNSNQKTAPLKSFEVYVANGDCESSAIATWLTSYFGTSPADGTGSIADDPDNDGMANLMEYALGRDPTQYDSWDSVPVSCSDGVIEFSFAKLADPSLRYVVESAPYASPSTWSCIWSSEGADNSTEAAEFSLPYSSPTHMRLRIETVDSYEDAGSKNMRSIINGEMAAWMATDSEASVINDYIWTEGFGWNYTAFWPWVYQWDAPGWMYVYGYDTTFSWVYLPDHDGWNWTSDMYWPWVWNEGSGWRDISQ